MNISIISIFRQYSVVPTMYKFLTLKTDKKFNFDIQISNVKLFMGLIWYPIQFIVQYMIFEYKHFYTIALRVMCYILSFVFCYLETCKAK